jgi:hypothetical protein
MSSGLRPGETYQGELAHIVMHDCTGAVMRTVLGEVRFLELDCTGVTDTRGFQPTGTSNKLVTMMCQALELFQEQHKVRLEKVTQIPLEGEGTISKRVEKCVYDPDRVIVLFSY